MLRLSTTLVRPIASPSRRCAASAVNPYASSRLYHHHFKPPLSLSRTSLLKAAPAIPILGSLFSSSAKAESPDDPKMSYPHQRSESEWQAVLSPGWHLLLPISSYYASNATRRAIPRPARKRHRTTLHRRIRHPLPVPGNLHLHRLQRAVIQGLAQVQVRLRLAGVLQLDPRRGEEECGQLVWDGAH
jgi:hypothetical protein